MLAGMLVLAAVLCAGVGLLSVTRLVSFFGNSPDSIVSQTPSDAAADEVTLVTNTPRPTLFLPTVTADAPPTRTLTPSPAPTETPGPCMQKVQPGDSLIALVSRCGHRDLDVIDLVLEINHLDAPDVIQVGQTIEIPWPTATPNPDEEATATPQEATGSNPLVALVPEDGNTVVVFSQPTPTLQPGVAWHQVAQGENIISIAFNYGADLKILSELNPEVTFSQCDFGKFSGGPSCLVNIFEGQQIRVPAPTPTPTLSPTPSGSETPTPSATPTFNAPSSLSPGDRALFQRGELITLRWVASGSLGAGQVYRVSVEDVTSNRRYFEDTTDLFLIVPEAWQGRDSRRHEYQWTVSVIDSDNPGNPYFSTEPRIFVWEAGEG
ncbi:MAG: LysM peptidoglycan-binding domain-containing protein [Anaerolineae bacterium]|nr:LysM peptidoglycan-binding domain-containing protein [Anaerolineae bacterium]